MPEDDVVTWQTGQALVEHVEGLTAVARSRDHEAAVNGDAALVFHAGNKPGRVRIFGMHRDCKAES